MLRRRPRWVCIQSWRKGLTKRSFLKKMGSVLAVYVLDIPAKKITKRITCAKCDIWHPTVVHINWKGKVFRFFGPSKYCSVLCAAMLSQDWRLLGWMVKTSVNCQRLSLKTVCLSIKGIERSVCWTEYLLWNWRNFGSSNSRWISLNVTLMSNLECQKRNKNSWTWSHVQQRLVNGHYDINLPLENQEISMPNNRESIKQLVLSLKKRLQKDSGFHADYTTFMNELVAKDYTEKVPEEVLNQRDGRVPN